MSCQNIAPNTHTYPSTEEQKNPKWQGKNQTSCVAGRVKWHRLFCLRKGKKSSQSCLDKTDGSLWNPWCWSPTHSKLNWCFLGFFFSYWFSFSQGLRLVRAAPALLPDQLLVMVQDQTKTKPEEKTQNLLKDCCCSLFRPGKGEKRNFLLRLTKIQAS